MHGESTRHPLSLLPRILAGPLLLLAIATAVVGDDKPVQPRNVLKEADGLELRFGYYPSADKLRLLVLHARQDFERWEAQVSNSPASKALAEWMGELPMPKAGVTLDVPVLDDGIYALRVELVAKDGTRREIHRTLERKRFDRENNSAGRDRVVVPPFIPLKVDADKPAVSCVLRRHELNTMGLWGQVFSQDCPLLASPMRLEIETAGKTHLAKGTQLTFQEKADDRVRGRATWTAGPVKGSTDFGFDYDGLMKASLNFEAVGVQVNRMRLVVPLRTEEVWLMHPVTDLLRFHYAGRIPDGKGRIWNGAGKLKEVRYTETGQPGPNGKVWDSRHVGRWKLPAPFVPYIWLGGPERGICWFAENARDWGVDPSNPCLEIRKEGGTTSLVVHLATTPISLKRTRRIVFGLMATPAKPMPRTPLSFRRWWTGVPNEKTRGVVGLGFMGSCYYWGAAGPCYSFYPASRDFSIYEEFARLRDGGKVDRGFTDRWLKQFAAPEFAPHLKTYRAHVDWSLNFFSGTAWRRPPPANQNRFVIPYTNGRAINWGEEVRTFMDEWSAVDIAAPGWPADERFVRHPKGGYRLAAYGKVRIPNNTSGVAYAVDPVPSWQDMVLHYHKRMLDTFADGIYFDDYFLVPNYNPLGPGYVDDDGNPRPGVNIFAFHDLTKRVAVMQHRMGRRPLVFIHMTNANIVPMLSHATVLLDHEWRDRGEMQKRSFHERLYLDEDTSLLLTQSTGLQSGCIGVIHNLLHDKQHFRGAFGVALVHEMKLSVNTLNLTQEMGGKLNDFGYGADDCQVWR